MPDRIVPGLTGIIPVLPTPFTADGVLDRESLAGLLEHALTWETPGLAVLGVAGEAEKLTAEEHEAVAVVAGRAVAGKRALVVGVSAGDARAAGRHAACAGQAGAAVVFAKCPAASHPDAAEREAEDYFRVIADAAGVPVMVQSFAVAGSREGLMSLASLRRAADREPRIRYVKEETPPPEGNGRITRLRQALGERLAIFSGSGGITLVDDLRRGAVGCMPGGVLVRGLNRVWQLWSAGKTEEADALHDALLPLILFRARWGSVAVTKTVLHEDGILPSAHVRPPADGHLDAQARRELRRLVQQLRPWV
jgi:4-hydroxy-tetrahydrodipicolinate synthase